MKILPDKKLIRCFEYAGYKIYLYPKRIKGEAIEFYLFDINKKLTKETLWIPKSSIKRGKDGRWYYGLDWMFDDYKKREKLEKIGYRL